MTEYERLAEQLGIDRALVDLLLKNTDMEDLWDLHRPEFLRRFVFEIFNAYFAKKTQPSLITPEAIKMHFRKTTANSRATPGVIELYNTDADARKLRSNEPFVLPHS